MVALNNNIPPHYLFPLLYYPHSMKQSFVYHTLHTSLIFFSRIPYQYLLEASFHNSTFNVTYQSANEANQTVQKSLALRCTHHRIARYLFRALTEDHTFFTHNTVSPRVRDHIRYKPWNHFCQHYLHLKTDTLYYFDVQRTLHEAYSYAWEILHQVNQQQMTLSISPSLQQSEQLDMDSTRQEESSSQHNQHSQQLQLGM